MSDKRQWFYKPSPTDRLTKEQEQENEKLVQEHERKQKEAACPTNSNS